MATISNIKVNGTTYQVADKYARSSLYGVYNTLDGWLNCHIEEFLRGYFMAGEVMIPTMGMTYSSEYEGDKRLYDNYESLLDALHSRVYDTLGGIKDVYFDEAKEPWPIARVVVREGYVLAGKENLVADDKERIYGGVAIWETLEYLRQFAQKTGAEAELWTVMDGGAVKMFLGDPMGWKVIYMNGEDRGDTAVGHFRVMPLPLAASKGAVEWAPPCMMLEVWNMH